MLLKTNAGVPEQAKGRSKGPRFGILLYTLTHAREKSLNFFAQATKNGQLAR